MASEISLLVFSGKLDQAILKRQHAKIAMQNWFTDLTGLSDDRLNTVRAGLAVDGDALVFRATGRRLRAGHLFTDRLADLPPPPTGPNRPKVSEVVADVTELHSNPENAGAVFQVASQFNLLEMAAPHVTPDDGIARYAWDLTQGPACAMACAAGTIWRNYLVPLAVQTGQTAARQMDMLSDLGTALGNDRGQLWRMQNGYALPHPGSLAKIALSIANSDHATLRSLIRVGEQRDTEVTLPGAGHLVTQVYCSALPIAYADEPDHHWDAFASLVLEAAYLATFAIAVRNARRTGNTRLFLTRLGGGAFGNPQRWITDAMALACTTYAAAGLDVRIVSYGGPDPANQPLLRG
jgi:hypothetical protein